MNKYKLIKKMETETKQNKQQLKKEQKKSALIN
jgi:hypothetical protein